MIYIEKTQWIKVLSNFEPFNDIWYKNCLFHALFPMIEHFNKDILPFILNDIFVYKYDKTQDRIKLKSDIIMKNNYIKILEYMDINVLTKIVSHDIVSDLINSINNERPVIIYIDCYYESIRPDTYNKDHCTHTLLIYGYDNIEKLFHILEHRYRDSYLYEKRTISYFDIINSYNGFINNLRTDIKQPTYLEFHLVCNDKNSEINRHVKKDSIYVNTFIEDLRKNKEMIYNGIEDLKLFTSDYKQIVFEESILKNNIDGLLNTLNSIINNKNLERYCILKIFNSKLNSINLCESIINNWSFIRAIIGKYKFSSLYNLKSFEKSIEKLNEIYDLECRWYDSLFCSYEQVRGL